MVCFFFVRFFFFKDIEEKIRTHAFSGGQETKALQEKLGANLEKDVAYQWLTFFMEDDEELKAIGMVHVFFYLLCDRLCIGSKSTSPLSVSKLLSNCR